MVNVINLKIKRKTIPPVPDYVIQAGIRVFIFFLIGINYNNVSPAVRSGGLSGLKIPKG